jgi:cytochrome c oxidase subunit 3
MDHTSLNKHGDYAGAKMGMWLFIATEVLLFGGMFLLYSIFRFIHPQEFHKAASELNRALGAANTLILLTSSLTMALSISALQKGEQKKSLILQFLTIGLGLAFMTNKYFEWGAKFQHGIYPNALELLSRDKGEILFYGLYFTMTGLHGIHVLAGIGVISAMAVFTLRNSINEKSFVKLENSGLYWHLVDVIWIYLFPLFYLIT